MFLRFVRLRLKPGKLWSFRYFYERRILSALQQTSGCLFAGLLEPSDERRRGHSVPRESEVGRKSYASLQLPRAQFDRRG